MTAAWDPKLCKSLVPIFNTILKERPYLRQASYILSLYRIDASGHRNLGSDHYQHFQHFSALVHSRELESEGVREIQSVWQKRGKCQVLFPLYKSQTCDPVSGDVSALASPSLE